MSASTQAILLPTSGISNTGVITTNPVATPGKTGSTITSATTTYQLQGAIAAEYAATAHETDSSGHIVQKTLGSLTSNQINVPGVSGAKMNTFQNGAIFWSPSTGAHVLYGTTYTKFKALGGPTGYGLPTSDESPLPANPSVRVTDFPNWLFLGPYSRSTRPSAGRRPSACLRAIRRL